MDSGCVKGLADEVKFHEQTNVKFMRHICNCSDSEVMQKW